ncbi:MAG: DUF362 domain-containing protein [Candidatus Thorarchaeota archaeon]|jgi:uncharacterized Fe-S center protein
MSSKPSNVYFGSVINGTQARFAAFAGKLNKIIEELDFSTIEKKDKVAIKMHLGFHDGYQTVPVFFVRRIVKAVKEAGGYPFVTDNPTAVYNAVERGYTAETCGCPIIPAAGVKDGYTKTVEINFGNVDTLELAGVMHDADVLIDLTHAKGHNTCGYGGAFKNIALGGYHGPSRWTKIHGVEHSIPYFDKDKITPEHAKKLVEACPEECIKYNEEKDEFKILFGMCNQCWKCREADKDVGSLDIKQENFSMFQELLAVASKEVLKTFDEKKQFFINFAIDITGACDCWGLGQPRVINDIGIVASRDIVAADHATLDLMAKEGLIESMIPPYYRNLNLDPDVDLHPFQRLHGPMKNPYLVTEFGEKLGLGIRNYELIEILSPEETKDMKAPTTVSEAAPSFF